MQTRFTRHMSSLIAPLIAAAVLATSPAYGIEKGLDDVFGQLPRLDHPGVRVQAPVLLVLAFTAMLALVLLALLFRGPGWLFWPFFGFGALAVSWLFGLWIPIILFGIPIVGVVRRRVGGRRQNVQVTYYAPPAGMHVQRPHYVEEQVPQPVVNVYLVHNAHEPGSLPGRLTTPLVPDAQPGYLIAPESEEDDLG